MKEEKKLNLIMLEEEELKVVEEYLRPGEGVIIAIRAGYPIEKGGHVRLFARAWFIVTNQRVMLYSRGPLRPELREWSLADIDFIDYEQHFLSDVLNLHSRGAVEKIPFYKDAVRQAREGAARLREVIREAKELAPAPATPPVEEANFSDLIRKLEDLKKAGVLTTREFEAKKRALERRRKNQKEIR